MSTAFDRSYFETSYRNYYAQNPARKIATYTGLIRKYVGSGSLLEVGCAFGLYAIEMSRFVSVTATDISDYAIEQARAQPGGQAVEWHAGDVTKLGLQAGHYDGIAAFDVLEHIPPIDDYLPQLLALLKPGGYLFLTVPVYDGPLGWAVRLLDKDPTHVHKWARGDWKALARRHGLTLREEVGLFRYGVGTRYVFFAHPRLEPVSPAIFLVLQKNL